MEHRGSSDSVHWNRQHTQAYFISHFYAYAKADFGYYAPPYRFAYSKARHYGHCDSGNTCHISSGCACRHFIQLPLACINSTHLRNSTAGKHCINRNHVALDAYSR